MLVVKYIVSIDNQGFLKGGRVKKVNRGWGLGFGVEG